MLQALPQAIPDGVLPVGHLKRTCIPLTPCLGYRSHDRAGLEQTTFDGQSLVDRALLHLLTLRYLHSSQLEELLRWLMWIETWSSDMTTKEEQEKGRQKRTCISIPELVFSLINGSYSAIYNSALPRASQAQRFYERRCRFGNLQRTRGRRCTASGTRCAGS
jgi:hypothetical protein